MYGFVTSVRNWMFDKNILKHESFEVPVVCVGNLTVGGTGKTPHVEYIVSLLSGEYNMAVLSRGYKRKTKGFVLANSKSTPNLIGDEPMQIYQKFGARIKVAVCENRRKGIHELLRLFPEINLIVLDDAFQHRYVKPKVAILLTDYNRPIYEDHLLPWGRLRENFHQINRADMVIATKVPDTVKQIDMRVVFKQLELMPYQKLFFSRYIYGGLMPVFPDDNPYRVSLDDLTERDTVLLVTGIAHPRYFVRHFKKYPFKKKVMHFPDHHDFTRYDLDSILEKFESLPGERKIIVTTEKDTVRFQHNPYFPRDIMPYIFYLPIMVKVLDDTIEDTSYDFVDTLRKAIEE